MIKGLFFLFRGAPFNIQRGVWKFKKKQTNKQNKTNKKNLYPLLRLKKKKKNFT